MLIVQKFVFGIMQQAKRGIESERDARDKHKRREEKIKEKNKWNPPERSRT
jgi:hypothetical protein